MTGEDGNLQYANRSRISRCGWLNLAYVKQKYRYRIKRVKPLPWTNILMRAPKSITATHRLLDKEQEEDEHGKIKPLKDPFLMMSPRRDCMSMAGFNP